MKKLLLSIVAGLLAVVTNAQDNESYVTQAWDNNYANIVQEGEYNVSDVYQTGTFWSYYRNDAYVKQVGHDNWAGLDQHGEGNYFSATQMGHDNFVGGTISDYAYQSGYRNSATILQDGYDQRSESSQFGENNWIDVRQYDHDQYSYIVQNGSRNGVIVVQHN